MRSCMPTQSGECPSDHTFCVNVLRPPPPAAPPLSLSSQLTVQQVTLSTTYSSAYPASNAIDGIVDTFAVSEAQQGNWLSVQLPSGAVIQYVAVHNRIDLTGGHFPI